MALEPKRAGMTYEIVVRGLLSEATASELGVSEFLYRGDETLIVIEVIDQSHLHGILNRLGDLNIDIESVNPSP